MKDSRGFSLIELLFVTTIIGIVASFAIPYLSQSTIAARESAAITNVRSLVTSQMNYSLTKGFGNFAPDLATLQASGYIDNELGSGTRDGYLYSLSGSSITFTVQARPMTYGSTGNRSFFSDESAVIRYNTADAPADTSYPPLGG